MDDYSWYTPNITKIYHTPFIYFLLKGKFARGNNRVISLCNMLGLSNRIWSNTSSFDSLSKQDIKWEEVDEKLLVKILEVFNSIPSQLAKENKKFQYSWIKKSARASEYIKAIQRLKEFGIISQCYNLSNLQKPLEGNKIDNIFKIYMRDSGLFIAMLDKGTAGEIISGNLGIYKGAIFENIVADSFSKMDRNLYYFEKDSGLEIDFVTTYKNEVTLI